LTPNRRAGRSPLTHALNRYNATERPQPSPVVVRPDLRYWYLTGYLSLVDIFAALADPVRRALLEELAVAPRRVVDLAATRPISRPAVSKHLRLLLESGAVTVTARGRERIYALDRTALAPVASYVAALAVTRAAPVTGQALDALETEVRRTGRERRPIAQREDEHEETA
jgi:DNA-binding transcriptional ArsR family regulator